jgi:two-component system, sensor histidine kinase and response regulator
MTHDNLTILVIDQDGDYAAAVQQNLERQTNREVEVVVEPDFDKAVDKMSDREFDVVLAKKEILKNERFRQHNHKNGNHQHHSVIGMLANGDTGNDGSDYVDGRGDFLVKLPIQPDVLTQLILSNVEKFELKASLQSTENDLRKIIEKNADSILVVDRNGALLYWNAATCNLFGSAELISGEIFGIPLIAGETTELDIIGRSGERKVAEMRVVDIEWNGKSACLASLRDVTQRKITEELLEGKVKDRTKQLEDINKELRKMYESAENAARVRSQFIANFSHEVRTPLGGIVSASEMLPMADDLTEYRELATSVANSSKQLLRLVESILDFSKLESGSVPLVFSDFDLRELIDSVIQSVTKQATENGTAIHQKIADSIPNTVKSDAVKIRQVILNLAHNAIKFTRNGTVEIAALIESVNNESVLKISVQDSGIGMSPQECEAIFQPFVQGNRKIHGRFGGTGLGLSICKQLVETMHGTINFCSEPEKGSTFWFAIPVQLK